ncbi:MAG: ABC transporter ATP-binding protein [Bacteroidota bacterium]
MKKVSTILKYVIPYWGLALLNIGFNILSVFFSLFSLTAIVPFLQILFDDKKITETTLVKPEFAFNKDALVNFFNYQIGALIKSGGKVEALLFICILVVVCVFIKNLFRYLAMFYLAPIRNGVVKDIRNDILKKILILPLSYYSEQRKGDIMSRMTSDVQEIEWSIMSSLEMIFRDPISILIFIVSLFVISPQLTLFAFVLLPVTGFLIARIGRSLKRTSTKVQTQMGVILSTIEETISGLRIIKAFNAIDYTHKKFKGINQRYTILGIRLYRKRDLASPLSEFLGTLVVVIILWFGGNLVISSSGKELSPSSLIMYLAVFSQIIPPAKSFSSAFYNIQKGVASVERVNEILNAEEKIIEKENAIEKKDFDKKIEYKNVSFIYEKEYVLKNINLEISKGKTIALVGPSGGGKSTLADLLPRFYDCIEGELLIDGNNIKDYKISDVRGLMGIVSQESILFNDSVLNNIAFGMKDITLERVIEAAKIANAHEFIEQMENGYETFIGDRGSKLSGGQRQRISIARAVLKNPPIMILDEATSALDTESEKLVQEAIYKLMQNRTSVVIAHRLSTIQHADEIIVLQQGEIVERGTHQELIDLDRVYKRLCDMQSFS